MATHDGEPAVPAKEQGLRDRASSRQLEAPKVFVADLDSKNRHQIGAVASEAVYAAPGYLLFRRDRVLVAQPFDAETTGDPMVIADQVNVSSVAGTSQFSASENEVLAYSSGAGTQQLTWFDRSGKVT